MYERGWGRVIHISSAHGRRASPFKAGYVSAKHGLEGLSKVIALEGAAHGVTSNCINPGYVRTPLVEAQIADQAVAHGMSEDEVLSKVILASSPVKRLIDPSEVATAAAFLCSRRQRLHHRFRPGARRGLGGTLNGPVQPAAGQLDTSGRLPAFAAVPAGSMVHMGMAEGVSHLLDLLGRDASAVEFERPVVEARAAGSAGAPTSKPSSGPNGSRCRCASNWRRTAGGRPNWPRCSRPPPTLPR